MRDPARDPAQDVARDLINDGYGGAPPGGEGGQERLGRWFEQLDWRVPAGVVAVVLLAVGGWMALRSDERAAAVVLPRAAAVPRPAATATTEPADVRIVVHAAGAVKHPGVYRLNLSARTFDLLEVAGGPVAGADLSGVNLAAPLADGARVHFPLQGQSSSPELDILEIPPAPAGSGEGGAPLDLNTADANDLQGLPGIGPVTAEAILSHRQQHGPFRSVDSLVDVSGIGPAKLERIKHLVTVTP